MQGQLAAEAVLPKYALNEPGLPSGKFHGFMPHKDLLSN